MLKTFRKTRGVTLLEIMLVLAVAAMIIVMSVRYYQSANTSQQANALLSQIEAITSAANSIAQGTGNFSAATTTSMSAGIGPILPQNGLVPPWGGSTITVGGTGPVLNITVPGIPSGVCSIVAGQLSANANFSGLTAPCSGTSTITYSLNPST